MEAFAPNELLGTNIHDAATYPDTPAGRINDQFLALVEELNARKIAHHFADEDTFEKERWKAVSCGSVNADIAM